MGTLKPQANSARLVKESNGGASEQTWHCTLHKSGLQKK